MAEKSEVRKDRWVMLTAGTKDHPVYGGLAANRWKVKSVKNGRADLGGVRVSVKALKVVRVKAS